MSDDRNDRGRIDRRFISLSQKWEVDYWRTALRCSVDELREAVNAVGNSSKAVREHLDVMRSQASASG
jgi:hypothetical protein